MRISVAWRFARSAALLCLAAVIVADADEMYRTVDAQGHVTYSDRPVSTESHRISIDVRAANPDEAARLRRDQADNSAYANRAVERAQEDEADRAKKAREDVLQQQRCAAARSRYALFAAGGRLTHADDQGNRVYYSDAEIEQQRTLSKATMEKACGTSD